MKLLFAVLLFIGIATAAKLPSNNYLPPPSGALGSSGHGGFLQGPSHPSGQYLPPSGTNVLGQGSFGQSHGGSHGGQYRPSSFGGSTSFGSSAGHYQPRGPPIPILKYENVNNGDGSYHFDYATGNGITQNEQGYLNNAGTDYAEQVVQGSYSYTGDDGHVYTVHYKADANGFQATGDHLPTPPPIPEAIQKSLIYNAQHSQSSEGYGGHHQDNTGQYRHQGNYNRPQQQYLPPSRPSGSFSSNSGYQY